MDKIKIVYNWIGPRFPLWNTEVPNLLGLAHAAEGTKTTSDFNFIDITWSRFFSEDKSNYEMYASAAIEDDDERSFILPFSLMWRINFGHYFLGNTGLLEYAHTPNHVICQVRDANGYILIDHSNEAFMSNGDLNSLHNYFKDRQIPLHKVIYVTGTINATAVYDEFCQMYNIPDTPKHRLSIVSYPSAAYIFDDDLKDPELQPNYNTEIVPEKLFLMWNRRPRQHRVEMVTHLEKNGLVDRSYISFDKTHIEAPHMDYKMIAHNANMVNRFDPNITQEHIDKFDSRLPLVLDGLRDIRQMCEDRGCTTRPYYQNSLISIITETNYYEHESTLTEKSFKPIKEMHPFIIVGAVGVLEGMRELGFKTFNDFWNEDYDKTICPKVRMEALSQLTDDIGRWTDQEIIEFKRNVKPILEHNYQLLKAGNRQKILDKINDIVRKHVK